MVVQQFDQVQSDTANIALHSHCRVLPPGKFNDIIPEPLPIYSEGFMAISLPFSVMVLTNNHGYQLGM